MSSYFGQCHVNMARQLLWKTTVAAQQQMALGGPAGLDSTAFSQHLAACLSSAVPCSPSPTPRNALAPAFFAAGPAGAAVHRRAGVAALAGARHGGQRAAGTIDRRYLVGGAVAALRIQPQRGSADGPGCGIAGPAHAGRRAGAHEPVDQQWPRSAALALDRGQRRRDGRTGRRPARRRHPAHRLHQCLGVRARHPQGPLQRALPGWRRRTRRGRLLPAPVPRQGVRGQPVRHLRPQDPAR